VWMKQIGAAPVSSMKTLEQTVLTVRDLLRGERVTVHAHGINLDEVQMELIPVQQPPIYLGAMREKSLQMAGRIGDGTILTGMSSPAYVRWAREQIDIGLREQAPKPHPVVVYTYAKVDPQGESAREMMRRSLIWWADVQMKALGIWDEVQAYQQKYGAEMGQFIPDAWIDDLSASGTPEQAAHTIQRLADAGADTILLQPMHGDPECLEEYIRYLLPLFK
jgi:5,10-methylenetetrahydromethanopterin reductase